MIACRKTSQVERPFFVDIPCQERILRIFGIGRMNSLVGTSSNQCLFVVDMKVCLFSLSPSLSPPSSPSDISFS